MIRPHENTDNTELAKTYFEYFKHYTTLSATAAVAVATLSDIVDIATFLLAISLGSFVVTLLLSVEAMTSILRLLHHGTNLQEGELGRAVAQRFGVVAFWFVVGVLAFSSMALGALAAAAPPVVAVLVASVCLVLGYLERVW